jgi:hypothetical protein
MPPMDAKTRAQIARLVQNKALRVAWLAGFDSGLMVACITGRAVR